MTSNTWERVITWANQHISCFYYNIVFSTFCHWTSKVTCLVQDSPRIWTWSWNLERRVSKDNFAYTTWNNISMLKYIIYDFFKYRKWNKNSDKYVILFFYSKIYCKYTDVFHHLFSNKRKSYCVQTCENM